MIHSDHTGVVVQLAIVILFLLIILLTGMSTIGGYILEGLRMKITLTGSIDLLVNSGTNLLPTGIRL